MIFTRRTLFGQQMWFAIVSLAMMSTIASAQTCVVSKENFPFFPQIPHPENNVLFDPVNDGLVVTTLWNDMTFFVMESQVVAYAKFDPFQGGNIAGVPKDYGEFDKIQDISYHPMRNVLYVADGAMIYAIPIGRTEGGVILGGGIEKLAGDKEIEGFHDGKAEEALFEGNLQIQVSASEDILYVLDRINFCLRKINLASKTVSTVVGICTRPGYLVQSDPLASAFASLSVFALRETSQGTEIWIASSSHQMVVRVAGGVLQTMPTHWHPSMATITKMVISPITTGDMEMYYISSAAPCSVYRQTSNTNVVTTVPLVSIENASWCTPTRGYKSVVLYPDGLVRLIMYNQTFWTKVTGCTSPFNPVAHTALAPLQVKPPTASSGMSTAILIVIIAVTMFVLAAVVIVLPGILKGDKGEPQQAQHNNDSMVKSQHEDDIELVPKDKTTREENHQAEPPGLVVQEATDVFTPEDEKPVNLRPAAQALMTTGGSLTSTAKSQGGGATPFFLSIESNAVEHVSPQLRSGSPSVAEGSSSMQGASWIEKQEAIEEGSWQKMKLLGRGANGAVYSCLLGDGSHVAMKEMFLQEDNLQRVVLEVQNEMSVIEKIKHPYVVAYYGVKSELREHKLLVFMELVTGGSLGGMVRNMQEPIREKTAQRYVRQVVVGLAHIHSKGVVHRDLKCDNILMTTEGQVKIADFGTAKAVAGGAGGTASRGAQTMIGTPFFMAPEILLGADESDPEQGAGGYGRSADIWSLGITVGELLNQGNPPWPPFANPGQAFLHIASDNGIPIVPSHVSADAKDFILQCCIRDPKKRPKADELLDHPWMVGAANIPKSPRVSPLPEGAF